MRCVCKGKWAAMGEAVSAKWLELNVFVSSDVYWECARI